MYRKRIIGDAEIGTSKNVEDIQAILKEDLGLKPRYELWNPFKKEESQFVGVLNDNWFEVRGNLYYQPFSMQIRKIACNFWKLDGEIVSANNCTVIKLIASDTLMARISRVFFLLFLVISVQQQIAHFNTIDAVIHIILLSTFWFLIFHAIPKSVSKTVNHLIAEIKRNIEE